MSFTPRRILLCILTAFELSKFLSSNYIIIIIFKCKHKFTQTLNTVDSLLFLSFPFNECVITMKLKKRTLKAHDLYILFQILFSFVTSVSFHALFFCIIYIYIYIYMCVCVCVCMCVCVCVCINIYRPAVSLYYNSPMWLFSWDASSWDLNPADFTQVGYHTAQSSSSSAPAKGFNVYVLFFWIPRVQFIRRALHYASGNR